MERKDYLDLSQQEIYLQLCSDWHRLNDLFNSAQHDEPPKLLFFSSKPVTGFDVDALSYDPNSVFPATVAERFTNTHYSPRSHTVAINTVHCEEEGAVLGCDWRKLLNNFFVHENTHAAVMNSDATTGHLQIAMDEASVRQLDKFMGKYDVSISSLVESKSLWYLNVSPGEFFPPLGQYHLLGYVNPLELPSKMAGFFKLFIDRLQEQVRGSQAAYETKSSLTSLIDHLPVLAGTELAQHYEGNISKLMGDYPRLSSLTGSEIWQDFCLPVFGGKIPLRGF